MPKTLTAHLEDRGVVAVTGPDAGKLLHGLVTNDLALLENGSTAIHAALLTPQGKIIADFFVVKAEDGYLLEVTREKAAELAKRIGLYKLRANVEIRDVGEHYRVLAVWGESPPSHGATGKTLGFEDPRLPGLGLRILADATFAADISSATSGIGAGPADYHAHRIALGVPEGGKDYPFGDTFPHEALLDQLNGVSFTKGCFVGQEVVSRMEHRTAVRKRVVPVVGEAPLQSGADVKAGDVTIGTVGSVAGNRGLALVRLDRAAEFLAKGVGLAAGGVPVRIELPAFAKFALPVGETQDLP